MQLLLWYSCAKKLQSQTELEKSCTKHFLTKKARVKCWWNWHLVVSRLLALKSDETNSCSRPCLWCKPEGDLRSQNTCSKFCLCSWGVVLKLLCYNKCVLAHYTYLFSYVDTLYILYICTQLAHTHNIQRVSGLGQASPIVTSTHLRVPKFFIPVVPNLFRFAYPYTVKRKLNYPLIRWQGVFYGIFIKNLEILAYPFRFITHPWG